MEYVSKKTVYTMTVEVTGQPVVTGYIFDEASRQLTRALAAVLAVGLSHGARGELVCGPVSDTEAQDGPQNVVASLAVGRVAQGPNSEAQAQAVRRLYMLALGLIGGDKPLDTVEDERRARAELNSISLDVVRAFPVAISDKVGK